MLIIRKLRKSKNIILFVLISVCILYLLTYNSVIVTKGGIFLSVFIYERWKHENSVDHFLQMRKDWNTSNLGKIMFLNEKPKNIYKNKKYSVLIWKHYSWLKNRHIMKFASNGTDPLDDCSVKNCHFSGNETLLESADAVVVHLQKGQLPNVKDRSTNQIWIFLSDESPKNTFSLSESKDWNRFVDIFNWSMTYRSDADIPVPYGRVVPLTIANINSTEDLIPNWKNKRKDVLVAILTSNCIKNRMKFVENLNKSVNVNVYGKCSKNDRTICPGHYKADCHMVNDHYFYLALENSNCKQYITEKVFYNAFSKGSIPIIMGPTLEECNALLPPNSFLHVDDYKSLEDLASDIINISNSTSKLLSYHKWRHHFNVINEHGYFNTASKHYCRICEALNYNDQSRKIYNHDLLASFLNDKKLCRT